MKLSMPALLIGSLSLTVGGCISINSSRPETAVDERAVSSSGSHSVVQTAGGVAARFPARKPNSVPIAPLYSAGAPSTPPSEWYTIASSWVDANQDKTVGGGRYELHFFDGSLSQDAQVTIREWDSHVLDFELGPHGVQFGTPVELQIDYSGTNADPNIAMYDGSRPAFYYFNDQSGEWEEIPGYDDRSQLKYFVHLRHFSRYALGTKASW